MEKVRSKSGRSDNSAECNSATPAYVKPKLHDFGKMQDIVHTGQDSFMDDTGMYEGTVGTMS